MSNILCAPLYRFITFNTLIQYIIIETRSLTKQIKDKKDHENKLREDLRRDATKLTELEKRIEEMTKEMERQRVAIDEHNKQYYECKKKKDQEQSARKWVFNSYFTSLSVTIDEPNNQKKEIKESKNQG